MPRKRPPVEPEPQPILTTRSTDRFVHELMAMDTSDFEKELLMSAVANVLVLTAAVRDSGMNDASLGDPEELSQRMIASIPRADPHNLELGPFYTSASLSKWMGVTRQYIHELVRQRRVLSLTTNDNHKIYPSFQFSCKAAPLPHMSAVLPVLDTAADPWAQAMWFMTESAALGDATPADFLSRGGSAAEAVVAANQSMLIFAGELVDTPQT